MDKSFGFIDHIVSFTKEEVLEFLTLHQDETFYSFAFDCNSSTNGIYLSFNTEEAYEERLKEYQDGEYAVLYHDEDTKKRLKYNPGDWKYQNFVSIEFIYDAKIKELFNVVLDEASNNLLEYAQHALLEFKKTNVYQRIPKTDDFIAFCIDHDEDELDALARALRIN